MANKAYDKDADAQRAPLADDQGRLQNAEQGNASKAFGDNQPKQKSVSPGGLNNREGQAANSFGKGRGSGDASSAFGKGRGGDSDDGLYNPAGDDRGLFGSALRGKFKGRGRVRRALKNKFVLGGAIGGGAGIVGIVVLLGILLGSLQLPNVMQNIESLEFARLSQQFSESSERVSEEALQVDAASEGTAAEGATAEDPGGFYGTLKSTYENIQTNVNNVYSGVRENTWGKLDQYRPQKVIEGLGENNGLELRFRTSRLTGRPIFYKGSIDGDSYEVAPLTGWGKWTPGLSAIMSFKNRQQTYSDFLPAVSQAMKTSEDPPALLVQGGVELDIVKSTGGNAAGWLLNKFTDSTGSPGTDADAVAAKNDAEAMDEMYTNTQAGATAADSATTGEISQADSAAEQAEQSDMQKLENGSLNVSVTSKTYQADNSNPYTDAVQNTIDQDASSAADADLTPSLTSTVEDDANPLSGLVIPACIVYDGSVQQSGPSINNNVNEQQNAFVTLAAEADEQEAGGPPGVDDSGSLGAAIGATNSELGDTSLSNPEVLAGGGTVNTLATPSAEAGSDGAYDYSIFDALTNISPSSLAGKIVNGVIGSTCKALTNSYVIAGGAIVNIGSIAITLGGGEVAEEAAGQSAREAVQQFANNVASNVWSNLTKGVVEKDGVKVIERNALNRFGRFVFQQSKVIAGTLGATELANMIVSSRSGIQNNGVAQGTSLVNEAMCGANIQAGENERHGLFGRPLTESEVAQSDAADSNFIAYQNQSKSFSQRYFSPSNANSLTSHVALDIDSEAHSGITGALFNLADSILRPTNLFGSLATTFDGSAVAAPNPNTQDCGDIQFGWSQTEEATIDQDQSYRPLPNEAILTTSGEAPAIAQEYAKCFGYSSDNTGALTSDISGDGSLGALIAGTNNPGGDIQRDSSGNVLEDTPPTTPQTNPYPGDCSPSSLGYNNNAYGPHMVFRWRLAEQYDLTLDQLLCEQSDSTCASSTASIPTPTTPPTPTPATLSKSPQLGKNNNWTGYALMGSANEYTMAKGTVVVPRVTCPSPTQDSQFSLWVGIDGAGNSTVEQDGIHANCNSSNQPYYNTWYEMVPGPPITTPLAINPGDTVNMIVQYDASTNEFVLSLKDETSDKSFSKSLPCPSGSTCTRSTAEWISENHLSSGLLISLFGSGTFSNAEVSTASNSNPTPFTDYTNYPTEGTHNGQQVESVTYPLNQGVSGFTIQQLGND